MRRLVPLALLLASCDDESTAKAAPPKEVPCKEMAGAFAPLSTRCGQFVDAQGRVVIMRGINARVRGVFDSDLGPGKVPLMPPLPVVGAADFARMRRIGWDTVRLPINWSAIEPEETDPPKYDDAYLDRVIAVIAEAKKEGVWVLVDFHQDAFSKWIGQDGAPLWAIQPPPDMILEGPLDDLGARRLSKQVSRAWETFFDPNSTNGGRLRGRFAAMAAHVAGRLKGNDAVVALELFNEPESTDARLRTFHEEVGVAVRAIDPARVIAFEPPVTRNFTDASTIVDTPLFYGGSVYAPHVYTGVFAMGCDEKCRDSFTLEGLRKSNENARFEAESWKAPLFISELGFDPRSPRFGDWVSYQLELEDEYMASSTWWLWKENSEGSWGFFDWNAADDTWTERAAARKAFARVQPRAIGGWPEKWKWDALTKRFELDLIGDPKVTAPTIVHVPLAEDLKATWKASCDGASVSATPDERGDLTIPCAGVGAHRIVVEGT